jgi:hypothetical protein
MLIFEKRELDNPQINWFVVPPLAEALQSFPFTQNHYHSVGLILQVPVLPRH